MKFTLTRDSAILTIGAIASAASALVGAFELFPWIPLHVQHIIAVIAFITTPILTFLKSSPLPVSPEGHQQEVIKHIEAVVEARKELGALQSSPPVPPVSINPPDGR